MKRINIFALLLATALILTGCGMNPPAATEAPAAAVVTEAPTEAPTLPPTEPPTEPPTLPPTEPPQPEEIAITLENWQEYFEMRETEQVYISETCSVTNRVFGYGVFLKEEYADRFAEGSQVSFELEYNVAWARVMGDLTADNYMIMGTQSNLDRKLQSAQLSDFRLVENMSEESDFYGQVAAEFAFDSEFGA